MMANLFCKCGKRVEIDNSNGWLQRHACSQSTELTLNMAETTLVRRAWQYTNDDELINAKPLLLILERVAGLRNDEYEIAEGKQGLDDLAGLGDEEND